VELKTVSEVHFLWGKGDGWERGFFFGPWVGYSLVIPRLSVARRVKALILVCGIHGFVLI